MFVWGPQEGGEGNRSVMKRKELRRAKMEGISRGEEEGGALGVEEDLMRGNWGFSKGKGIRKGRRTLSVGW